jgi:hypothetical protein
LAASTPSSNSKHRRRHISLLAVKSVSCGISSGRRAIVSRSAAQRAENESAFRSANEDLERKVQEWGFVEQPTPYLCECEDRGCTEVLLLARSEYEGVRGHPRRFFIVPGHDAPEDRVVDRNDKYHVVEKTGEEGRLVEEQDPRSARGLTSDG